MIETELGQPPDKLFAEFDPQPLAAASIGQVHPATLHDGRRVAVKVQYPGVEQAIKADLANTELLVTFFRLLTSTMAGRFQADWRGLALEVSERIGEEIDYRMEAANQQQFASIYRRHPFIRIPEVHPQFSTRRVLTMDLVEGLRYADALAADQPLRDHWAEAIYRFNVGSLGRNRMINADPHPGNYLFHPDGTVTFLDFGCVKHFTEQQVLSLARTVRATIARDPDGVAAGLIASKFFDPDDAPTTTDLFGWWSSLMTPLTAPQPFTYTPEFASQVLRDELSPHSPFSHVIRKITGDANLTFLTRFDSGMNAVLAALRATGPWSAIRAEYDPEGPQTPPSTPMGQLDAAYRSATP
jgi:ABC1 atypical kinase-like domain